jgi:hypothetical protein
MMAQRTPASIAPSVIAQAYDARVAAARARGQVIELDVLNRAENDLRAYAKIRGAREIWWRDGRKEILDADEREEN